MEMLDKLTPFKKKYLKTYPSKFVIKELSKATMLRTKLRNQLLKAKTHESRMKYNKQRNIYVRKSKRSYYENLDLKKITDNKKFWSAVKPLFNKIESTECINIQEDGKIIGNDKEITRIFHELFVKIAPSLGINANHNFLINAECLDDPTGKAIIKYNNNNHPSILTIKKSPADLVIFTEEILNGKLQFFVQCKKCQSHAFQRTVMKYILK